MMQKLFLSEKAKCDLLWWIRSIPTSFNLISRDSPEFTLYTDSSLIGWGAHLNDQTCGDNWRASEKENHINYLELLAIYLACKAFKLGMATSTRLPGTRSNIRLSNTKIGIRLLGKLFFMKIMIKLSGQ
jgi:hypothetical protein